MHKTIFSLSIICMTLGISGCATVPPAAGHIPISVERTNIAGIYHKIEKGQTLWAIARLYDVNIDDIVKANKLPNTTSINTGQFLFIPNAVKVKKTQPSLGVSAVKKSEFIWPAKGKIISFYGCKKDGVLNKGIDIGAKEGMDVTASRPGKVVFCDTKLKGYGQTIIIDHLDGFSTLYAYNSAVLANLGDYVKQGQVIAKAGSSGRTSRACLHFEIRKGDKPQNPFYYLPR